MKELEEKLLSGYDIIDMHDEAFRKGHDIPESVKYIPESDAKAYIIEERGKNEDLIKEQQKEIEEWKDKFNKLFKTKAEDLEKNFAVNVQTNYRNLWIKEKSLKP